MKEMEAFPQDSNKALRLRVKEPGETYDLLFPRELLDDEVGDDSSFEERQSWVENHLSELFDALGSRPTAAPWNRVIRKEVN
jgi:hypothetical protein